MADTAEDILRELVDAVKGSNAMEYTAVEGSNEQFALLRGVWGRARAFLAQPKPDAHSGSSVAGTVQGWTPVSERLPRALQYCDWLMPETETKRETWILCGENSITASVPGLATHWRPEQPLPTDAQTSRTPL